MKYLKYLLLCAVFCFTGPAFAQDINGNVCFDKASYDNCINASNNLDTLCLGTCDDLFQNCLAGSTDKPTCKADRASCQATCADELQQNYGACFGFYCLGPGAAARFTSDSAVASGSSTVDVCPAAVVRTEPMSRSL